MFPLLLLSEIASLLLVLVAASDLDDGRRRVVGVDHDAAAEVVVRRDPVDGHGRVHRAADANEVAASENACVGAAARDGDRARGRPRQNRAATVVVVLDVDVVVAAAGDVVLVMSRAGPCCRSGCRPRPARSRDSRGRCS